jgi:hypothetical protein
MCFDAKLETYEARSTVFDEDGIVLAFLVKV